MATTLNNLALVYDSQGKHAEAEELYQRALAIREKELGPSHPDVAYSLNNLANVYREQAKYAEAAELFERARANWEKALGASHPLVATALSNLATVYPPSQICRGYGTPSARARHEGEGSLTIPLRA